MTTPAAPPPDRSAAASGASAADGVRERVDRAGPLRHRAPVGPPQPGSAHAVVAGVPCAALPLPWDWGTQASLTAVPASELVATAAEVTAWLARHGSAGWQLEVGSAQAAAVVEALGLRVVREHEVRVSTAEPPVVDLELSPPADEEEFLAVFGPPLAPMVRGQLGRPDWEVAVLRDGGAVVGCLRLLDLGGTTYVGGLTVVPHRRGEGLGHALSAEATRRGRRRSDLVWLQCEPGLGPFYARLGYRLVGRSTFLGPR